MEGKMLVTVFVEMDDYVRFKSEGDLDHFLAVRETLDEIIEEVRQEKRLLEETGNVMEFPDVS